MDKFYPSEIARLVLGYLKEVRCPESWQKFLVECTHLQEYYQLYKDGEEYSTEVNGKSLKEILREYCILKRDAKENSLAREKNNQVNPDSSNNESFKTPSKSNRTASFKHRSAQKIQTQSVTATLRCNQVEESLLKQHVSVVTTPTTPRIRTPRRVSGFTVKSLNFSGESSSSSSVANKAGRMCYSDPVSRKSHRCVQTDISTYNLNQSLNLEGNNGHPKHINSDTDFRQTSLSSSKQNTYPNSISVQNTTEILSRSDLGHQESVFQKTGNEAFDTQSLTVNKSIVCRTSESTGTSNIVVTTLETSFTPQYENEAPPYNRAPGTNSPRLILSMDRSQISSLTTPMKNRKTWTEEFSSPRRKSFIPRRRLLTDSPVPKQMHPNDKPATNISNDEWESLEEFIIFPPLVQKITENINKVINTDEPLNISDGPSSSNCLPVQEVIKNVCEETEKDPVFDEFFLKMLGYKDIFDGNFHDNSNCLIDKSIICDSNIECLLSQQTNDCEKECIISSDKTENSIAIENTSVSKSIDKSSVTDANISMSENTNKNVTNLINNCSGSKIQSDCMEAQNSTSFENVKENSFLVSLTQSDCNSGPIDECDSSLCKTQSNYELPSDTFAASQLASDMQSTTDLNTEKSEHLNPLIECDEIQIVKEIPPTPIKTETSSQNLQFITNATNTNQNVSAGSYFITNVDNNGLTLISPFQNNNNSSIQTPLFQVLNTQVPTFIVPPTVPTETPNADCQYKIILNPNTNWNCNNLSNNFVLSQPATPGKSFPNPSIGNCLPLQTVTPTQIALNSSISSCLPLQASTPEKSVPSTSSVNPGNNSLPSNLSTNGTDVNYTPIETGAIETCITTSSKRKRKTTKKKSKKKPLSTANNKSKQASAKRSKRLTKSKRSLFPLHPKEIKNNVQGLPVISIPDPSPGKSNSMSAMELLSNITGDTEMQSPILKSLVSNAMTLAEKSGRLNSTHVRMLDFDDSNVPKKNKNDLKNIASKSVGNLNTGNRRSSTRLQLKNNQNVGLTMPDLSKNLLENEEKVLKTPSKKSKKKASINKISPKNAEINSDAPTIKKTGNSPDIQSSSTMKDAVLNAMTHVLETNEENGSKIPVSENIEEANNNWNSFYISQSEVEEIDLTESPLAQDQSVMTSVSTEETTAQSQLNENGAVNKTDSGAKFFPSSDSDSDSENVPLSSLIVNKSLDTVTNKQNNPEIDFVIKSPNKNVDKLSFSESHELSKGKSESISRSFTENAAILSDDTCELPPLSFDLPVILKNQDSKDNSNKISPIKEKEPEEYSVPSKFKDSILKNSPNYPVITPKQVSKKRPNKKCRRKSNEPLKISTSKSDSDNSLCPTHNAKKRKSKSPVYSIKDYDVSEIFDDKPLNKDSVEISQEISDQPPISQSSEICQTNLNDKGIPWILIPLDLENNKCNKLRGRNTEVDLNLNAHDLSETNYKLNLQHSDCSASRQEETQMIGSDAPSSNVLHKSDQNSTNTNNFAEPLKDKLIKKSLEQSIDNQDLGTTRNFLSTNHLSQKSDDIRPNEIKAAKTDRVTKIVNKLLYIATSPVKDLTVNSSSTTKQKITLEKSHFHQKKSNYLETNSTDTSNSSKSHEKILPPPKKRIRPVPIPSPRDPRFSPFTTFCSDELIPNFDTPSEFSSEKKKVISSEPKDKTEETVITNEQIQKRNLSGKPKALTEFYKKVLPFRESSIPISPDTVSSSSCTLETFLVRRNLSESFIINDCCEDTNTAKDADSLFGKKTYEEKQSNEISKINFENNSSIVASNNESNVTSSIPQIVTSNEDSVITSNSDSILAPNVDSVATLNDEYPQKLVKEKRKLNNSSSSEFECSISNINEMVMNENEDLVSNELSFDDHSPLKKKQKIDESAPSNIFNSSPLENNCYSTENEILSSVPPTVELCSQALAKDSPVRSFSPSKNTSPKSILSQRTEQNPKIPSGVKIPSKWNTSKISSYSTSIENCQQTSKIAKENNNIICKDSPSKKWTLRIAPTKSPNKRKNNNNKKRLRSNSRDRKSNVSNSVETNSPKKRLSDYHRSPKSKRHSPKSQRHKSFSGRSTTFRSTHSYKCQDKKTHNTSDYRHNSRSKNSHTRTDSIKKLPKHKTFNPKSPTVIKSNNKVSPCNKNRNEVNISHSPRSKQKIPDTYVYKENEIVSVKKPHKTYGQSKNVIKPYEISSPFVTRGTFDFQKQFSEDKTPDLEEGEILEYRENNNLLQTCKKIEETTQCTSTISDSNKLKELNHPNKTKLDSEHTQINSDESEARLNEDEELLQAIAFLTNENLSSKSCEKTPPTEKVFQSNTESQSISPKTLSVQFCEKTSNKECPLEKVKNIEENEQNCLEKVSNSEGNRKMDSEEKILSKRKVVPRQSPESVFSTQDNCSLVKQSKNTDKLVKDTNTNEERTSHSILDLPSNSTSLTTTMGEKKKSSKKDKDLKDLLEKINTFGVETILNMLTRKTE